MAYNHKEFMAALEKRRDSRAYERVVRDLGNDTVVSVALYPDEDSSAVDYYGEWENKAGEWRIDRKEGVLLGEQMEHTYYYHTHSQKCAETRAAKRAKKDGFELDEDSPYCAETYTEGDEDEAGKMISVTYTGYKILARDIWVNSRFDSYRDMRYFAPPVENYKGIPEDEQVKYCLQDHRRMEELCNDEWSPAYATATAYYKGHQIEKESLSGFESEYGMSDDWITETMDLLTIETARQEVIKQMKADLADLES